MVCTLISLFWNTKITSSMQITEKTKSSECLLVEKNLLLNIISLQLLFNTVTGKKDCWRIFPPQCLITFLTGFASLMLWHRTLLQSLFSTGHRFLSLQLIRVFQSTIIKEAVRICVVSLNVTKLHFCKNIILHFFFHNNLCKISSFLFFFYCCLFGSFWKN